MDIVIDNRSIFGDDALAVGEGSSRICHTSTVVGAPVLNMLVAEVIERRLQFGICPAVFISANVEAGDEYDSH